jgi:polar amino acid transport system permease protein
MRELQVHDLYYLIVALRWTLLLALISFSGGTLGGILLALARRSSSFPLRFLAGCYVSLLQGTPLLMQLFLAFFGLSLLGFDIPPLVAAALAMTCNSSAYLGEIWRGCIDAIPKSQWDGSIALGMTRFQQFTYVIAPQALKIAIPPTANYSVQIVKNTALTSIIGFVDVTKTATILNNSTFSPVIIFGTTALIYFVICFALTRLSRRWEAKP